MRRVILYIVLCCCLSVRAWDWWPLPMAQPDTCRDSVQYLVSVWATAGSGAYNTFWLQSEEQGYVSAVPFSGALRAAVLKPATRPNRWYDYDGAVDIMGMVHSPLASSALLSASPFPVYQGRQGAFIVRQCYAHVRLYIVDVSTGVMNLADDMNTPLGTGSLLLSSNAPSMPAIHIGLDRWTPIPGLFGYLEVRGGLTHAWLTDRIGTPNSKLHYKWAGVQLGGSLPVNISYEFHHAAQWGGYDAAGNDLGNSWRDFRQVFLARRGGTSYNETNNALGNHLGSQQLALTAKGKGWNVKLYWQNLLEDNFHFIGKGQNLPDGRWGITAHQDQWPFIHTCTIEYIATTDQSGPLHDQDGIIYAGDDNYYVNSVYQQGWNYYLRSLGTPLITSPLYNADGYTQTYNNRIRACHIGIAGDIYGFAYRVLATHVTNYGTYKRDDWYTPKSHNTALLLEVNKHVEQAWGLDFGVRIGADFGTQWGNQVGAMLTVSKKGLITSY